MSWFREFFRPALKCERTGKHAYRTEVRRFYREPTFEDWDWRRTVAYRVTEKRDRCCRCGRATPWTETTSEGLTGLTMPQDMWDEMRENGRVYL